MIIAGVDEVGRGSLIGPVFAAAVILDKSIKKKLLKDSKSLTKSKREILSKYIKKKIYMVYRKGLSKRD
jgi:ribonuclease HII